MLCRMILYGDIIAYRLDFEVSFVQLWYGLQTSDCVQQLWIRLVEMGKGQIDWST